MQSRVEKGAVPGAGKFSIEVIDIDLHPNLEVQWGDKVPVLLGKLAENDANHNEICHYFLDEAKLFAYLVLPSQA